MFASLVRWFSKRKRAEVEHYMLHSSDPVNKHGIKGAVIGALKQNLDCAWNYFALAGFLRLPAYFRYCTALIHLLWEIMWPFKSMQGPKFVNIVELTSQRDNNSAFFLWWQISKESSLLKFLIATLRLTPVQTWKLSTLGAPLKHMISCYFCFNCVIGVF